MDGTVTPMAGGYFTPPMAGGDTDPGFAPGGGNLLPSPPSFTPGISGAGAGGAGAGMPSSPFGGHGIGSILNVLGAFLAAKNNQLPQYSKSLYDIYQKNLGAAQDRADTAEKAQADQARQAETNWYRQQQVKNTADRTAATSKYHTDMLGARTEDEFTKYALTYASATGNFDQLPQLYQLWQMLHPATSGAGGTVPQQPAASGVTSSPAAAGPSTPTPVTLPGPQPGSPMQARIDTAQNRSEGTGIKGFQATGNAAFMNRPGLPYNAFTGPEQPGGLPAGVSPASTMGHSLATGQAALASAANTRAKVPGTVADSTVKANTVPSRSKAPGLKNNLTAEQTKHIPVNDALNEQKFLAILEKMNETTSNMDRRETETERHDRAMESIGQTRADAASRGKVAKETQHNINAERAANSHVSGDEWKQAEDVGFAPGPQLVRSRAYWSGQAFKDDQGFGQNFLQPKVQYDSFGRPHPVPGHFIINPNAPDSLRAAFQKDQQEFKTGAKTLLPTGQIKYRSGKVQEPLDAQELAQQTRANGYTWEQTQGFMKNEWANKTPAELAHLKSVWKANYKPKLPGQK